MVAASILRKLSSDLDALSGKLRPFGGVMFVAMPEALEPYKERVIARHRKMFPDEADADFVAVTIYESHPSNGGRLDPDDYSYLANGKGTEGRSDEAWRLVARKLVKSGELKP